MNLYLNSYIKTNETFLQKDNMFNNYKGNQLNFIFKLQIDENLTKQVSSKDMQYIIFNPDKLKENKNKNKFENSKSYNLNNISFLEKEQSCLTSIKNGRCCCGTHKRNIPNFIQSNNCLKRLIFSQIKSDTNIKNFRVKKCDLYINNINLFEN